MEHSGDTPMPSTRNRVPSQTDEAINQRIARGIERSVRYHARSPDEIQAD